MFAYWESILKKIIPMQSFNIQDEIIVTIL